EQVRNVWSPFRFERDHTFGVRSRRAHCARDLLVVICQRDSVTETLGHLAAVEACEYRRVAEQPLGQRKECSVPFAEAPGDRAGYLEMRQLIAADRDESGRTDQHL